MRKIIYFDTSALAKWYLNEEGSEDVEKHIQENGPVDISDLTIVEIRCLLSRRRRERNIDPKTEMKVFATFEEDIRQRFLICHPLPDGLTAGAVNLLSVHPDLPIRTLDALHLMIAREIQAEVLATADRVMAAGAKAMGFSVVRFDRPVSR
ncbi:MAG: type II toxin-antitoxin system VapC family toxin [Thermodesulfobacteriota bacterium]|nr:type II toxin-antitoxin system VapC family toxin [Thermodesulfobacteriota bacterium]